MPYAEDDLLPISALQHLLFCERQTALIHIERVWAENRFTAEGQVLHKKAHDGKPETRDGQRITRGLPLRSIELGLTGVADIVLYEPPPEALPPGRTMRQSLAAVLHQAPLEQRAAWTITPVEYKRGRPKKNDSDRVQLCAQALCLEEMHKVTIPMGELFYGKIRRRTEVAFDESLRTVTMNAVVRLRELLAAGITPRAVREKKCETCSLLPICLPDAMQRQSARRFLDRQVAALLDSETNSETNTSTPD